MEHYKRNKKIIKKKLKEFSNVKGRDVFYELCFCLLTPQTKAHKCWGVVLELKKKSFLNKNFNPKNYLYKSVRFHNNKSRYLIGCKKKYNDLINDLKKIKETKKKREFLVKNVKGLGYKEASHFLRNIGYKNLAILDRHILKNLVKYRAINNMPKTLTKKKYLDIEKKTESFSKKIKMPMDELDLLFWSMETGEVFK